MNSNIILSGLISIFLYLLIIFSLLLYFNAYHEKKTVGKKESFNVEVISFKKPTPIVQEKKQVKAEEKTAAIAEPKPLKEVTKKSKSPKAAIAELFDQVAVSKTAPKSKKKPTYQSSYKSQKLQSRDSITIDSIKDVTIASVKKGDIDDPLIMELQEFLHKRWNPPRSVGVHRVSLDVRVTKDGKISYFGAGTTSSSQFNEYVEYYKTLVNSFKPIEKELHIELILETKE